MITIFAIIDVPHVLSIFNTYIMEIFHVGFKLIALSGNKIIKITKILIWYVA